MTEIRQQPRLLTDIPKNERLLKKTKDKLAKSKEELRKLQAAATPSPAGIQSQIDKIRIEEDDIDKIKGKLKNKRFN